MKKTFLMKITYTAEQYINLEAETETEAINETVHRRLTGRIPYPTKNDLKEVSYEIVPINDRALQKALEYILDGNRNISGRDN